MVVVRPAEGVGGTGEIGQTFAGRLGEGECDAYVTSVFEHQVGKIVGGDGIIGLDGECFLVKIFGLLPIAASFEKARQRNIDADIARVRLHGALVSGDGLVHGAFGNLGAREHEERRHIVLVEIDSLRKSFFCFVVLLILELELAKKRIELAAIGNLGDLILDAAKRFGRFLANHVDIDEASESIDCGRIALQRIGVEFFSLVVALLIHAEVAHTRISGRIRRGNFNRFLQIGLCAGGVVLTHERLRVVDISFGRARLHLNHLLAYLRQRCSVTPAHSECSKSSHCFHQVRAQVEGLFPFGFRLA